MRVSKGGDETVALLKAMKFSWEVDGTFSKSKGICPHVENYLTRFSYDVNIARAHKRIVIIQTNISLGERG